MKLLKLAGATSEIWQVFIQDSSSTTGAGLTGLAFNTASLTAYYHRDTDTTVTAITLATMTVGTFTSSGFKEIDATNMPGWYQFCPPNAALGAGAKSCGFHLKGAASMAPLPIECQLTAVNPDSAVAFITGVNSIAPPSNWNLMSIDSNGRVDVIKITGVSQTGRDIGASVLLSSGTGTGQVKIASGYLAITWADIAAPTTTVNLSGTTIATTQKVDVDTIKTNPVVNAGTVTFPTTIASTTNITAGTITTTTNLTNAPTAGDFTATMKTSLNAATPSATIGVGGIQSSSFAAGAIDAAATSADFVTEIVVGILDLANGIETGLTPRQAARLIVAAVAAKLSGAATTTTTIRNAVADSKDRIVATVDASGNRSAITYDLT